MKFLVETSARHCHLTLEHFQMLFGEGASMTKRSDLSQPGEFAAQQRVQVVGPKGSLDRVIVIGPAREYTQVEASLTDLRKLGVTANIRESGELSGTSGATLVGPAGTVLLLEGVIAPKRHLHTTPQDAKKLGVQDRDIVSVRLFTKDRAAIFGDVVVRVSPRFATRLHIDTDEANAVNATTETYGEIIDSSIFVGQDPDTI